MEKFFITTAIPYVNDRPHLGHAMEFVISDVLGRYSRQNNKRTLVSMGADEHGNKIYEKAQEQGQEPQAFVDAISDNFKSLAELLNVKFDKFIRTTEPGHIKAAQTLWQKLAADIYKDIYTGYYCTGCEKYISPQECKANKGICPEHERPYDELKEENYFFRLSKYVQPIKEAISKDQLRICPQSRKNEILNSLRVEDISFSRPKAKVPWGIPVPGDDTQVMYVWPEALTNYLTAAGYPEEGFTDWWPADVHVIGKDITRFHTVIWPAMLLAAGLELPRAVYAHGFITVGGKKMSKSLGNSIDPVEAIKAFGADAFRYYVLHEIPSDSDGDFSYERLEEVYNSDLANDLGNLVQRVAAMVNQYQKGMVGNIPPHSHDITPYSEALADFRFDRALDEVWLLVRGLNQYVEEQKPWQVAKRQEPEHLSEILSYLVSNVLQVGNLLAPFLPDTAERIAQTFADGSVHSEVGLLFPKRDKTAA